MRRRRSPCSRSAVCSSCACRAASPTRGRKCCSRSRPRRRLTLTSDRYRQARPQDERGAVGAGRGGAWRMDSSVAGPGRPFLRGSSGARARWLRLALEASAARLIVDRVEGNLLAAKQELEMLALLAERRVRSAPIVGHADRRRQRALRRDSRSAEAAAAGEAARALRVLTGLRGEGAEPALILWALVRELRGLWQARERDRTRVAYGGGAGWNQAAKPSPRALRRDWARCRSRRCCKRPPAPTASIKGIAVGRSVVRDHRARPWAWPALCKRTRDSGRVAV